jgi:Zn-dependent M28 family amino/carboxypeptidase
MSIIAARASYAVLLISVMLLASTAATASAQSGHGVENPVNTKQPGGVTPFSAERAYEHVKKLVEFGARPSGSKALARSRRYILDQLRGGKQDEWVADTPAGKVKMVNIIFEAPGETEDTIVLASHYDTKPFKDFSFVGANDGGSSTGVLIELARAFAASNARRHFTYRFVFFDGEEAVCREWDECGKPGSPDNTYGSRRYVAQLRARDQLRHMRALILLDMIGYEKLELGRDTMSTPWLVDVLWKTAREVGYAKQFVEREEGVGGDDHEPFLLAGVPSVDLIQLSTYPHWHTPEDTLDKIAPFSLKAVGDVVLASLPRLEEKLKTGTPPTGAEGRKVESSSPGP